MIMQYMSEFSTWCRFLFNFVFDVSLGHFSDSY